MLDCRQHHHMSYIGELLSHDFLSFDNVCRHARNWSLVANRACQHDVNIVEDAGVHDPAGEDFFSHGSKNSASLANCIDGAQMVLVPPRVKARSGFIPNEVPNRVCSTSYATNEFPA